MTKTFRLEFSEKQQNFHHNNGTHKPESNGYVTICEHCTDLEYMIFESYIDSLGKEKYTLDYVQKTFAKCKAFMNKLIDFKIDIVCDYLK